MEIDDFENEDTKCFIPKNNGNNKGKLNILSSSDEDSDSDEEISDISIDEKLEDENKKKNKYESFLENELKFLEGNEIIEKDVERKSKLVSKELMRKELMSGVGEHSKDLSLKQCFNLMNSSSSDSDNEDIGNIEEVSLKENYSFHMTDNKNDDKENKFREEKEEALRILENEKLIYENNSILNKKPFEDLAYKRFKNRIKDQIFKETDGSSEDDPFEREVETSKTTKEDCHSYKDMMKLTEDLKKRTKEEERQQRNFGKYIQNAPASSVAWQQMKKMMKTNFQLNNREQVKLYNDVGKLDEEKQLKKQLERIESVKRDDTILLDGITDCAQEMHNHDLFNKKIANDFQFEEDYDAQINFSKLAIDVNEFHTIEEKKVVENEKEDVDALIARMFNNDVYESRKNNLGKKNEKLTIPSEQISNGIMEQDHSIPVQFEELPSNEIDDDLKLHGASENSFNTPGKRDSMTNIRKRPKLHRLRFDAFDDYEIDPTTTSEQKNKIPQQMDVDTQILEENKIDEDNEENTFILEENKGTDKDDDDDDDDDDDEQTSFHSIDLEIEREKHRKQKEMNELFDMEAELSEDEEDGKKGKKNDDDEDEDDLFDEEEWKDLYENFFSKEKFSKEKRALIREDILEVEKKFMMKKDKLELEKLKRKILYKYSDGEDEMFDCGRRRKRFGWNRMTMMDDIEDNNETDRYRKRRRFSGALWTRMYHSSKSKNRMDDSSDKDDDDFQNEEGIGREHSKKKDDHENFDRNIQNLFLKDDLTLDRKGQLANEEDWLNNYKNHKLNLKRQSTKILKDSLDDVPMEKKSFDLTSHGKSGRSFLYRDKEYLTRLSSKENKFPKLMTNK